MNPFTFNPFYRPITFLLPLARYLGTCQNFANMLVDLGIAVRANDPSAVPCLLEKLSEFGGKPSVDHNDTRMAMLSQAKALVRALQTPRETMIEQNWAQVCARSV